MLFPFHMDIWLIVVFLDKEQGSNQMQTLFPRVSFNLLRERKNVNTVDLNPASIFMASFRENFFKLLQIIFRFFSSLFLIAWQTCPKPNRLYGAGKKSMEFAARIGNCVQKIPLLNSHECDSSFLCLHFLTCEIGTMIAFISLGCCLHSMSTK